MANVKLNNKTAEEMLKSGDYELKEYKGYVLVNKKGNHFWVTDDLSDIVTDRYAVVTDTFGVITICHRSALADNPLAKLMFIIRDKLQLTSNELIKVAMFLYKKKITVFSEKLLKEIKKILK